MKRSILVIDDDVTTVEFLEILFTGRGYDVITALTSAQGVDLAQRHRPSLLLVDVMMPDMNGYEVCRRLRADSSTSGIPIVILTGRASLADQTAGIESGADRYLIKPMGISRLVDTVDELISQREPPPAAPFNQAGVGE